MLQLAYVRLWVFGDIWGAKATFDHLFEWDVIDWNDFCVGAIYYIDLVKFDLLF